MNKSSRDLIWNDLISDLGVLPDVDDPIEEVVTAAVYNPANETAQQMAAEIQEVAGTLQRAANLIELNYAQGYRPKA